MGAVHRNERASRKRVEALAPMRANVRNVDAGLSTSHRASRA
jgi:hypothetical protein